MKKRKVWYWVGGVILLLAVLLVGGLGMFGRRRGDVFRFPAGGEPPDKRDDCDQHHERGDPIFLKPSHRFLLLVPTVPGGREPRASGQRRTGISNRSCCVQPGYCASRATSRQPISRRQKPVAKSIRSTAA